MIIIGYVDDIWVFRKVKKVKKKFEFFKRGSYIESLGYLGDCLGYYYIESDINYINSCMVYNYFYGSGLIWLNFFGRGLGRLFLFGRLLFYVDYND